jgi:hypothetical protein
MGGVPERFRALLGHWRNNPPELRHARRLRRKNTGMPGAASSKEVMAPGPRAKAVARFARKMPHLSHAAFLAVDIGVWFERSRRVRGFRCPADAWRHGAIR